jgi:hypothetical protein
VKITLFPASPSFFSFPALFRSSTHGFIFIDENWRSHNSLCVPWDLSFQETVKDQGAIECHCLKQMQVLVVIQNTSCDSLEGIIRPSISSLEESEL